MPRWKLGLPPAICAPIDDLLVRCNTKFVPVALANKNVHPLGVLLAHDREYESRYVRAVA